MTTTAEQIARDQAAVLQEGGGHLGGKAAFARNGCGVEGSGRDGGCERGSQAGRVGENGGLAQGEAANRF